MSASSTMSDQDQINSGHIIQDDSIVTEDQGNQQVEQVQVLSLSSISDIIKGEIKGVRDYIEETISKSKVEEKKVEIKFKGNRIQYEFNAKQEARIQRAITKIDKGDNSAAKSELKEVLSDIKLRNKHIKIADKSEGGWKVVDEYKSEELADNSDDEKRIKAARKTVAANAREEKKQKIRQSRRSVPYNRSYNAPSSYPNPDSVMGRGNYSFRRSGSGSTQQFRVSPSSFVNFRASDRCFGCGKAGHWRSSCPEFTCTKSDKAATGR